MPRGSGFGSGSKTTRKAKSRANALSTQGNRGTRGSLKALTIGKKKKKKK